MGRLVGRLRLAPGALLNGELWRANHPLAASANRGSKAGPRRRPPETSATCNAPNNNFGKVGFDNARRNGFGPETKLVGISKVLPPAFAVTHSGCRV